MTALAVALAAISGGLLGGVEDQYDALHGGCGVLGQCSPASYHGIQRQDVASKVLFGAAGAAFAVDVGLWVAWARERRASSRSKALP